MPSGWPENVYPGLLGPKLIINWGFCHVRMQDRVICREIFPGPRVTRIYSSFRTVAKSSLKARQAG